MTAPLSIAVAQPRCVSYDVAANAREHAAAVRAAGARVVVFPELSLTGYELEAEVVDPTDRWLAPIVEACADTGTIALAGAPIAGDHIAMLAIDGDGATVVYRKLYLGDTEAVRFTPGDGPAVLVVDGWRLGLAICKDTGVERHASDTAALGIDAYVAGVVKHDHEAELMDARARRIATAHGVWVVMASAAGATGGGFDTTAGRSSIRGRDGIPIAQAGPEAGAIARATLTPAVAAR